MIDAHGNCSDCGGTHYGSTSCPFACSRCMVRTDVCAEIGCPRNERWRKEAAWPPKTERAAPQPPAVTGNAGPGGPQQAAAAAPGKYKLMPIEPTDAILMELGLWIVGDKRFNEAEARRAYADVLAAGNIEAP